MKLLGTSTSKCSFYPEAAGISGASSPRDEELTAGLPSVATVKNSPLIKERAHESLWKRLFPWATYPPLLVGMRDPSSVTPLGLYQLHTLYLGQPVGSLPLAHLLR